MWASKLRYSRTRVTARPTDRRCTNSVTMPDERSVDIVSGVGVVLLYESGGGPHMPLRVGLTYTQMKLDRGYQRLDELQAAVSALRNDGYTVNRQDDLSNSLAPCRD